MLNDALFSAPGGAIQGTDPVVQETHGWGRIVRVIVWIVGLEIAVYGEGTRLRERLLNLATTGWWIGDPDPDATFFLPILLLAPFCFLFPLSGGDVIAWFPVAWRQTFRKWATANHFSGRPWSMVLGVSLLSLTMSWITSQYELPGVPGKTFGELGPYVHDEFSYQFQAETYLAGRLSWPGVPRARELFHRMHVLNEEHFASRYFPATGAWLALFVALGFPIGASWLAGMPTASLAAIITRKTHGETAGWLAGILVATAPGPCLFNNLLLAHGPTLVGLMVCLYCFRSLFDQLSIRQAFGAGSGLTLAMLSRPLTAASVALPFGVWWWWNGVVIPFRRGERPTQQWWQATMVMGAPLLVSFAILAGQNAAITGNIFETPYSQYNRLYTPRHVLGYRASDTIELPPEHRYLREYDEWAKPLTWTLAWSNLKTRLKESLKWSLGLIPLVMGAVFFLLTWRQQAAFDRLLLMSIVSLHLAHFPYWLSGMLGYHYVFESGVLWLMLLAGVIVHVGREAMTNGRVLAPGWIAGMIGLSFLVNFCRIAPGTTVPRVITGIRSVTHVAERFERFRNCLVNADVRRPALVLVKTTPADLHVEYVRNRPPFDGPLLVGRYRPDVYSDAEVLRLFPERTVYLYDSADATLHALTSPPVGQP